MNRVLMRTLEVHHTTAIPGKFGSITLRRMRIIDALVYADFRSGAGDQSAPSSG
jgi:hypothetical protein